MKKLLFLAIASLLSTNSYSLDSVSNGVAYTLAQTIYVGALSVATSEAGTISISKIKKKAEALRIQKDAQDYFQTGIPTIFLESKVEIAKNLDASLSERESVDLLLEATQIILSE